VLCLSGLDHSVWLCVAGRWARNGQANSSGQLRVFDFRPCKPQSAPPYNAVSFSQRRPALPISFRISSGRFASRSWCLIRQQGPSQGTPSVAGTYDFTLYISTLGKISISWINSDGRLGSGKCLWLKSGKYRLFPPAAPEPTLSISPGSAILPVTGHDNSFTAGNERALRIRP